MKILHLLNHVHQCGNGIVNVATDIACTQASLGHAVSVGSSGGEFVTLFKAQGVQHLDIPQRRTPVQLAKSISRLRRIIVHEDLDVIHCHMMTGMVLARLLRSFIGRGVRLVSHVHNVHQRSAVLMGLADRVITVSAAVSQDMAKRGIASTKMRVVVNRTSGSPRTSLERDSSADLDQPAIVTVAGMSRRKGIAELISAFERIAAEFPSAALYLVGDGPDRAVFEAQAGRSPVAGRIHFKGYQENPSPFLTSAAIFVLASHRDSCPLVIPEARSHGCAIVASDVDGIPELLDGGRAGVLVPPGNVIELANAIANILRTPGRVAELQRASADVGPANTVADMTREVMGVYEDLIAAPGLLTAAE